MLSLCCQSSAPVSAPSSLLQQVATQALTASPLMARAPSRPGTHLPIIVSLGPACCPLEARREESLPVPTVEGPQSLWGHGWLGPPQPSMSHLRRAQRALGL